MPVPALRAAVPSKVVAVACSSTSRGAFRKPANGKPAPAQLLFLFYFLTLLMFHSAWAAQTPMLVGPGSSSCLCFICGILPSHKLPAHHPLSCPSSYVVSISCVRPKMAWARLTVVSQSLTPPIKFPFAPSALGEKGRPRKPSRKVSKNPTTT